MSVFERTEWTETSFINQGDMNKRRIAFIGDSIVRDAQNVIRPIFINDFNVDFICSSRAIDSAEYEKELFLNLSYCKYEYIFFNNGLHGKHMSEVIYEEYYEKTVLRMMCEQRNAKLMLGLSTPVTRYLDKNVYDDFNETVLKRNEIVKRIADKYKIVIIDSYALLDKKIDVRLEDGYHYTEEGQQLFAENIFSYVR